MKVVKKKTLRPSHITRVNREVHSQKSEKRLLYCYFSLPATGSPTSRHYFTGRTFVVARIL